MNFCLGVDANCECSSNIYSAVNLNLSAHLFNHALTDTKSKTSTLSIDFGVLI